MKDKIISPNFLHAQRSTYKRTSQFVYKHTGVTISLVVFILLVVGVIDFVRAEENTVPKVIATESSQPNALNESTPAVQKIYVKSANSEPNFTYDKNTIVVKDNFFTCLKDDHILQWQKGIRRWVCAKPVKTVLLLDMISMCKILQEMDNCPLAT